MELKNKIIAWYNGPQDYEEGLALLRQASKKNKVIGKLIKRGSKKSTKEKLIWELKKCMGVKEIPKLIVRQKPASSPASKEKKSAQTKVDKPAPVNKLNLIGRNSIDLYPPLLQRVIIEYSSLYKERGKAHRNLKSLGDSNEKEVVEKRQAISLEINRMSNRMDLLYDSFRAFEVEKVTPDAAVLYTEEHKGAGPAAADSNDIDKLKGQKKNLQSSLTKDRNMLLYSDKTKPKDGKKNPLPDGPEKTRLQKRVAKKEQDIKAIAQRIADLE